MTQKFVHESRLNKRCASATDGLICGENLLQIDIGVGELVAELLGGDAAAYWYSSVVDRRSSTGDWNSRSKSLGTFLSAREAVGGHSQVGHFAFQVPNSFES